MLYLITGNPHKLVELRRVLPPSIEVEHKKLELDEIQSLDLHEIVHHKLREAYKKVKSPVMVEDVSAELASLNGLPGPFIKFFEKQLGKGSLYKVGAERDRVKIICTMGYFDGKIEKIVDGVMEGIVVAPRGKEGFGFDFVIIPDGYDKTVAELGVAVKDTISHRAKAMQKMVDFLTLREDS